MSVTLLALRRVGAVSLSFKHCGHTAAHLIALVLGAAPKPAVSMLLENVRDTVKGGVGKQPKL